MERNDYLPASERRRVKDFSELLTTQDNSSLFLQKLAKHKSLPSIFLHGPPGSGKYTRLLLALQEIFKGSANPFHVKLRAVSEQSGSFCNIDTREKSMLLQTSQCHCVLDLAQPTVRKGFINFMETFCRSKNIGLNTYKYLVLRHVNKLEENEQSALRRIIELYSHNVRLLVTSSGGCCLHPALRSRFLNIRVASPTREEATRILLHVAKQEKWKELDIEKILDNSRVQVCGAYNLSEMLLVAEVSSITGSCYIPDRQVATNNLLYALLQKNKKNMRNVLEDIYIHRNTEFASLLFSDLTRVLLQHIDTSPIADKNKLKHQIIQLAAKWDPETRSDRISYPLLPAEAFYFKLAEILT